MSSSLPDTAATKRDVDSYENIDKFVYAEEAKKASRREINIGGAARARETGERSLE